MGLFPRGFSRDHLPIIVTAIGAYAAVFVIPAQLASSPIAPDFLAGYFPGAVALRAGRGYVNASDELITHWPPGLSVFIVPWLRDTAVETIAVLQHVYGVLAIAWVCLLSWLSRRIVPRVSLWLVLPLSVALPILVLSSPSGTEMLFAVLVTASVCLLIASAGPNSGAPPYTSRADLSVFAAGALLGLASLVKTLGLPLVVAAACVLVASYRTWSVTLRIRRVALFLAAAALVTTPWLLEYRAHTGHVGFSSAGVWSIQDGILRFPDRAAGAALVTESEQWRTSGDIGQAVWRVFRAYPDGTLALLTEKAARVWYATDSGRHDRFLLPLQLPWLALFLASALLALWRFRQERSELILLHAMVLATWASAFLVLSIFRYLAPVFAFVPLIVLARVEEWRTRRTASPT